MPKRFILLYGEFEDMEEPPAGTWSDYRYISIMIIIGPVVCVVSLFLFLTDLSPKPLDVAHETS
ncbi:MAG: hypothetical protein WCF90_09565 [Methanomicrobiales archaeon]